MNKPRALGYERFSDDVFMLLCRAETPVSDMHKHPVIAELVEQLDDVRKVEPDYGYPFGPITKPRAWRGVFNIGDCYFRIPAMYVFPKFYGLVCDTLTGTHKSEDIVNWVETINDTVAADLGFNHL